MKNDLASFIERNRKTINNIRLFMIIIFGVMIVIDIVLALFLDDDFPTFSEVIMKNRTPWLWLNFLLGGLISKIFYSRKVYAKRKELSGFFVFTVLCVLLSVLGQFLPDKLGNIVHFLIMVSGGLTAHLAWPQYIQDGDTH